jgi:hypothetical protein
MPDRPPGELAIGIVAQLGRDDRALPGEKQELVGRSVRTSSGVSSARPTCC